MRVNFSNTPFKSAYRFYYGGKSSTKIEKFQDMKFFCRVYDIEHKSLTDNCYDRKKHTEFKDASIVAQISVDNTMDSEVERYCNVMGIEFDKIEI